MMENHKEADMALSNQCVFKDVEVTLDLKLLHSVTDLQVKLERFKPQLAFKKHNDVYKVEGSWLDIHYLYQVLSSASGDDNSGINIQEAVVLASDDIDEVGKTVIEKLVNGGTCGKTDCPLGSMMKFKYNKAIICYIIGKYHSEIKKLRGNSLMTFKPGDTDEDIRLSLKGNPDFTSATFQFIDEQVEKFSSFGGIHFDFQQQLPLNLLHKIYDSFIDKYKPKLVINHNRSWHCIVFKTQKQECNEYLKSIDLTEDSNIVTKHILDAVCTLSLDQNMPSTSNFLSSKQEREEQPMEVQENGLNLHIDEQDAEGDLVKITLTGDSSVIDYIITIERKHLVDMENKYNVSIDETRVDEGILTIISNDENSIKNMGQAKDAIAGEIQKYHFDLSTEILYLNGVEEKWAEIKDEFTNEAEKCKIRARESKMESSVICVGQKEDVSSLIERFYMKLFPETIRPRRMLVTSSVTDKMLDKVSRAANHNGDITYMADEYHENTAFSTGKVMPLDFEHKESKVILHAALADITKLPVDAIVNAANEDLQHFGGVALAIKKAGGYAVNKESADHVRFHGKLQVTKNCITSAGDMKAHHIIHAVGPRWNDFMKDICKQELGETYRNILITADQQLLTSIAIPAISSGIFAMPQDIAAEIMVKEMVKYLNNHIKTRLKHIHLVDIQSGMVVQIQSELLLQKISLNHLPNQPLAGGTTDYNNPLSKDSRGSLPRQRIMVPASQSIDRNAEKENSSLPNGTNSWSENSAPNHKLASEKKMEIKPNEEPEDCCICMCPITNPKTLACKHKFCTECIDRGMKIKPVCPMCGKIFGALTGNQPPGTMTVSKNSSRLPGYSDCGTIVIKYNIPGGTQTDEHPNPGVRYSGASRTGYLPDSKEGRKVSQLLRKAFDSRLVFTVGRSVTSGADNIVTWNDIHHKTSTHGGAQGFGYPDPDYLKRVQDELAAKGIK